LNYAAVHLRKRAAVLIPDGYFSFEVPCDRRLPGYHVIEFGRPYAEVVEVLHRTADRLEIGVVGFSDQSVEQVVDAQREQITRVRDHVSGNDVALPATRIIRRFLHRSLDRLKHPAADSSSAVSAQHRTESSHSASRQLNGFCIANRLTAQQLRQRHR